MTPWLTYPPDLQRAEVLDRPNRFVLSIRLGDGTCSRAHLADPGRLSELGRRGWTLLVQGPWPAPRLPWRAVAAQVGQEWVSLRPTDANLLGRRLLADGWIPGLGTGRIRSEVSMGHERFDLSWEAGARRALIEVKSASLVLDGVALFPDAVSDRASRHLERLMELAREGHEPHVLFVAQRGSARVFRPAESIDPCFAATLRRAIAAGLRVQAWAFRVTHEGVGDPRAIPVEADPS
ncbi:MAG TPA: DNA/RNA nuclease SfsA [Myxococcota bacterium]|nr:DNA/RNA nuclease SfsA [Myxococcota bacterium]HQK51837.1 DNA/RNA nuclease SfsA [Myxococcota bacterium]